MAPGKWLALAATGIVVLAASGCLGELRRGWPDDGGVTDGGIGGDGGGDGGVDGGTLPYAGCRDRGLTGTRTVNVASVSELNAAVSSATTGDVIIVAAGTYALTGTLNLHTSGVTLRGATGDRDDVALVGSGMNTSGVDEGISVGADDVTVRDLTVRDFYFNGIHTRAENDVDRTCLYNLKTVNIGERHIKGSRNASDAVTMSDDIIIERVHMLQTIERGTQGPHPDYIGGIDMMAVNRLRIVELVAEGIRGHTNDGNAAIFLWSGVKDVVLERNRIIGCAKGIALGNPFRVPPFPGTGEHHAQGGVIRNNMVLRGVWTGGNNISLELASTRDVKVLNNTFYSADASYFRTISISHEGPGDATANVVLGYNLIRGAILDGAGGTGWSLVGNVRDETGSVIVPGWFDDVSTADFHLTAAATGALGQGASQPEVLDDFDGELRPGAPDLGADERP